MSRQLFEDKDLHDLSDLTPQSAPQPKPEEPQEDYSKDYSGHLGNHQDDAIVNHLHKSAGVLKAGHVGPVVWW